MGMYRLKWLIDERKAELLTSRFRDNAFKVRVETTSGLGIRLPAALEKSIWSL